jgi:hypothetical protein
VEETEKKERIRDFITSITKTLLEKEGLIEHIDCMLHTDSELLAENIYWMSKKHHLNLTLKESDIPNSF